MFRYIIRPHSILTTPNRLKTLFNAQRTLAYPYTHSRRASLEKDFFLAYPSISDLTRNAAELRSEIGRDPVRYTRIHEFYRANKPQQRELLRILGFNTPTTYVGQITTSSETNKVFIARPFRHSGGRGYRLLRAEPTDDRFELLSSWNPTQEYLQEFYPKNYEYRVILARGHVVSTLIKRHPDLSNLVPWNHSNGSSFVTVNDINNNRLRHTDVYNIIEQNQEFFGAIDLCALDILVNLHHEKPYVVCELNFCPSLTIESNLTRLLDVYTSIVRQ